MSSLNRIHGNCGKCAGTCYQASPFTVVQEQHHPTPPLRGIANPIPEIGGRNPSMWPAASPVESPRKAWRSSRDEYAEEEVRRQLQSLGTVTKRKASGLSSIDSLFDVTGNSGIPADLNNLYSSFSAWAASPSSASAQQMVIANAGNLASDVQSLAGSLAQGVWRCRNPDRLHGHADQPTHFHHPAVKTFSGCSRVFVRSPASDASRTPRFQQTFRLVDVPAWFNQPDGTVTVLMDGGSPLRGWAPAKYSISTPSRSPSGAGQTRSPLPPAKILDSAGQRHHQPDSRRATGRLAGCNNNVLASLVGRRPTSRVAQPVSPRHSPIP